LRHINTGLNALAFLWASVATLYLLVVSDVAGGHTASALGDGGDVVGDLGLSLASADGVWVVGLLILVTVLAGLPLGVSLTHHEGHRLVTGIAAWLLLGFSLISGFSLGMVYLPVPLLMFASVATGRVQARGVTSPELRGGTE
jgi:hypothetical protein